MDYFLDIDLLFKEFEETLTFLQRFDFKPELAIIAGSGISESLIGLNKVNSFKYSDIPKLIESEVQGQNKELIFGYFEGKKVLVFNGRFHIYEGLDMKYIISPAIISYFLGIKNLILTNATGGLNPIYKPGDIMIIDSMINLMFRNISYKRINDYNMFNSNWNKDIQIELTNLKQKYYQGIYAGMTGPSYETSSEIRMLRTIDADAVGMSIIHEATTARYLDMNITACSLITNTLTETNTKELTHNDVLEIAEKSKYSIYNFFKAAIKTINENN